MHRFSRYLAESKNLHLEHLEDSLFNEGSKGVKDAILFCESLLDMVRSEEHTSELQSRLHLVCRLLLEKKKISKIYMPK